MKFNKTQKRWLKTQGLWGSVKKATLESYDEYNMYATEEHQEYPHKKLVLDCAFTWETTEEGLAFWVQVNNRMYHDTGEV